MKFERGIVLLRLANESCCTIVYLWPSTPRFRICGRVGRLVGSLGGRNLLSLNNSNAIKGISTGNLSLSAFLLRFPTSTLLRKDKRSFFRSPLPRCLSVFSGEFPDRRGKARSLSGKRSLIALCTRILSIDTTTMFWPICGRPRS